MALIFKSDQSLDSMNRLLSIFKYMYCGFLRLPCPVAKFKVLRTSLWMGTRPQTPPWGLNSLPWLRGGGSRAYLPYGLTDDLTAEYWILLIKVSTRVAPVFKLKGPSVACQLRLLDSMDCQLKCTIVAPFAYRIRYFWGSGHWRIYYFVVNEVENEMVV